MIVKTNAIVLRARNLRETSKFLTMYTESFGKLTVVAKGVRQLKSRLSGVVEPFNIISVVLYKKENRDVHYLSSAEIIEPMWRLTTEFNACATALAVAELLDMTMHDEERNQEMFTLLAETFRNLALPGSSPAAAFVRFQIRLISIMGYGLDIHLCARCRKPLANETRVYFRGESGNALCAACESASGFGTKLSPAAYKLLTAQQTRGADERPNEKTIEYAELSELERMLNSYIAQHCENKRRQYATALMSKRQ